MKVVQINCVYPFGSTGKIVQEVHKDLLDHGVESVVCYGRGDKWNQPGIYKTSWESYSKAQNILSRATGLMYGGCMLSTRRLIRLIEKQMPDIVHLHCINGYFVNVYRLIRWLNDHRIKTVITHHAEFLYTANCSHAFDCDRWKWGCGSCPDKKKATKSWFFDRTAKSYDMMKHAFEGFGVNLVNCFCSSWGEERGVQSPIISDFMHCVIYNGVDVSVFHHQDIMGIPDKKDDEKRIFHVTANFDDTIGHPKGGWAVIELARRMKDMSVKFYVAAARQSIKGDIPDNLILLDRIDDQKKLAEYYAMSDVSVITSKRETFSMPCVESLCCGTPVVAFKAGAPERIAIRDYSEFVEYGDVDSLERAVYKWLYEKEVDKKRIGELAIKFYSNKKMAKSYRELYQSLLGDKSV